MRRFVLGGLAAAAALLALIALSPGLLAQDRGLPSDLRFHMRGPGAEIGIAARDLRKEETSRSAQGGVVVEEVREGSPAARAGLKAGDVIVEFDGERVRSVRHLVRLIDETPADRTVEAAILRDGSKKTVDISPAASNGLAFDGTLPDIRPQIERGLRAIPRGFRFDSEGERRGPLDEGNRRLGVSLSPLTEQLAAFFGVKSGVLVSSVDANSPAARAGLKAGDVIVAVNGHEVGEPLALREQIRGGGGTLDLRLSRDRRQMTVKVELPQRATERRRGQPV